MKTSHVCSNQKDLSGIKSIKQMEVLVMLAVFAAASYTLIQKTALFWWSVFHSVVAVKFDSWVFTVVAHIKFSEMKLWCIQRDQTILKPVVSLKRFWILLSSDWTVLDLQGTRSEVRVRGPWDAMVSVDSVTEAAPCCAPHSSWLAKISCLRPPRKSLPRV